uniref:Zinc finger protein n=1 Tax=Echinococcus granulosus TaxID=6210 RepID=A0A068WS78_ECHGR|nr:zinc finger protein [Echinococcus granulosus]
MRPDFIYCGSCSLEFPLSELTFFIEHKRSNCSNSLFESKYEGLQCSQCVRIFHSPWPLLFHVQNDHGIKLVRNLNYSDRTSCQPGAGLKTPLFSYEQMECSANDHIGGVRDQDSSLANVNLDKFPQKIGESGGLFQGPLVTAASPSSTSPQVPRTSCRASSSEAGNSGLKFHSVSYAPNSCSTLNMALNLEDSLRLIHKIACSKLDMHLRQMTSVDVTNASSSYALSLCCSQAGVSCLCAVGSCSCSSAPPPSSCPQLTASASCQTDGLSDPHVMEEFSPSNLFSLPDQQSVDLDKSPVSQDLGFINSLIQPPCVTSPNNDLSFQPTPQPIIDHPPADKVSYPPKMLPFSCSFCGRIYRQKIHLRKHVMAQHTKQKPFFCPHCAYTTVEKSHLTVHIRTHTGERPYICRVCHYSSTQNCTLKSHYLRKHPESKITCVTCGGTYITELEYQNHLKNCGTTFDRML